MMVTVPCIQCITLAIHPTGLVGRRGAARGAGREMLSLWCRTMVLCLVVCLQSPTVSFPASSAILPASALRRTACADARLRNTLLPLSRRRRSGALQLQCAELHFELDEQGRERLNYSDKGFDTWHHTLTVSSEESSMMGKDDSPDAAPSTDTRSVRVNYIQHGDTGLPVVFVHGFGASGFHWRYQIAELAKTHRVFALDLLGFGLSDKPNISYSNEYWGMQVSSFIREVVGEPAVVVGNSLGCIVSLKAATLDSSLIRGLVFINTPGNFLQGLSPVDSPLPLSLAQLPLAKQQVLTVPRKWQRRVAVEGTRTLRRLYRVASAAAFAISAQQRQEMAAAMAWGGEVAGAEEGRCAGASRQKTFAADDVRRACVQP